MVSENDVLARWLLLWVRDAGGTVPLTTVHRLWMMDHVDVGLSMPQKNAKKGAKFLKEFLGATMGRQNNESVLRGVRPSDDRELLAATHALVTGTLVPLQNAMDAEHTDHPIVHNRDIWPNGRPKTSD